MTIPFNPVIPSSGGASHPSRVPLTGAGSAVAGQISTMSGYATQAYNLAADTLRDFKSLQETLEGGVNFEDYRFPFFRFNVDSLYSSRRPRMPGNNELTFQSPNAPAPVSIPDIDLDVADFGDLPDDIGRPPELNFGNKPIVTKPDAPDSRPSLIDVTQYIPEDLTVKFPELPTFEDLNLPDPPSVIEHDFTGVRPTQDLQVPNDSEVSKIAKPEYKERLMKDIEAELRRKMKGGTGLPPAIEQMLFTRAKFREEETADRAIMEAVDDWASRGFSLPSGILDKKIQAVRQENQSQANAFSREIEIQSFTREQENLQFAITQGMALENISVQIFTAVIQQLFAQAQAIDQFGLSAVGAKIELFNAEVNMFRIEAEVYRELIRAELNKIETYRAQIESQRVIGELNQQKIDLYRRQLDGLSVMTQIYATRVQAADTVSSINQNLVRTYEADISAYRAGIESNRAEFEAWQAEIQGELGKIQGYEAEARAFSARASAYEAGVNAKTIVPRLEIDRARLNVERYRTDIQRYGEQLRAETERINAMVRRYEAEQRTWDIDTNWQIARQEGQINYERLRMDDRKMHLDVHLRDNELRMQEFNSVTQTTLGSMQAAGQIASQLASSAMSAVNVSASTSESGSASNNWSYSVVKQEDED